MMNNRGNKDERFAAAKEYSLKYLSYRPRTAWEVRKKLLGRGYDDEIVNRVVDFLAEYKFLDDDSFIEMWIRSRTREKPSGRRRIYAELAEKGLDRGIIDRHLAKITPQKEQEMAEALVQKKCLKNITDYKRLRGFLLRRGFDPEIVNEVLTKFTKNYPD